MEAIDDDPRWTIIAPLLLPLRKIAFAQLDERKREGHLQSVCAGLVLTLPVESSAEEQRSLRVALELLHTLWTLDREAWRSAIVEGVGIAFPASLVLLPPDELPHVVVSVKHDKFPWQIQSETRWKELFTPDASLSPEKAVLLDAYGEIGDEIPQKIPVVLQFLVFGLATSVIESYLSSIVDMSASIQSLTSQSSSQFKLAWLGLELSHCPMTVRRSRQVIRLHALGIPFRELTLRLFEVDGREELIPQADCIELMAVLLGSSQRDPGLFNVETLTIAKADSAQFFSVCSAFDMTKTVKNLRLSNVFTFNTAAQRSDKWRWLTSTLFASRSQTSIKHLVLEQFEFQRLDVVSVQTVMETLEHQNLHGDHALETLTIQTEATREETIQVIPALVALIGTNLRCLSVYAWVGAFSTTTVHEILTACRLLESLDVSCLLLDSFDVFLDAYDNQGCKIRSLSLHETQVESVHVTAFARALSDPTRRCTQVIHELCLDAVGGGDSYLDEANLDAFLHVLDTNHTLEYLELQSPDPLLSTYMPRFEKHDQTWLPRASKPLQIESKAAFLSLTRPIRGNSHEDKDSEAPALSHSIPALDDRVVSLVFQFAATPAKRSVFMSDL